MPGLLRLDADRMWQGQELDRLWIGGREWVKPAAAVSLLKLTDPVTAETNHVLTGRTDTAIVMTSGNARSVTTWNIALPVGTKGSFEVRTSQRVLIRYAPAGTVQLNSGDTYLDGTFANWTAREFTITATRAIFGFLNVVNGAVVEVRNFKAVAP